MSIEHCEYCGEEIDDHDIVVLKGKEHFCCDNCYLIDAWDKNQKEKVVFT